MGHNARPQSQYPMPFPAEVGENTNDPGIMTLRNRSQLLYLLLLMTVLPDAGAASSLFTSQTKIISNDAAAGDKFGSSVAISGDTLIVGAPESTTPNGLNSGAAYVFVRDGTGWNQQAKLAANDGAVGDFFGVSVSVSGDTVVVGAYGDDGSDYFSGSAYVFVRDGTSWTQQAKLFGNPTLNEQFGTSSAISGDTIVVGSAQGNWGYAYVFVRNGTTWTLQQTLPARGRSVAIEWDTIVVGGGTTLYEPDGGLGTAYIFVRDGSSWVQQARLTGNQDDYSTFGSSVSISGDTVAVGAIGWSNNGAAKTGHAYTFTRSGGNWPLQQVLTASDAAIGDAFGASIAIEGNLLIVGAPQDSAPTYRQGSAYVYVWDGTRWVEREKLLANDAADSHLFGYSVSTTRGTVVSGTRFAEAAYVYEPPSPFPPPPDTRPPKIAITTPANNATVSGTAVAISAQAEDNAGIAGVQFKLDEANLSAELTAPPFSISWNSTATADGSHTLTAVARDAAGNLTTSSPVKVMLSNGNTSTVVWVEDTVPAGAWTGAGGGDTWQWINSNPAPLSGASAHQSALVAGTHYHYFSGASATLSVNAGETLITHVFLDASSPPQEIMLQWFDGGSWAHAAYWGGNLMSWGKDGTAGQWPMGALPPTGQWVRLEIPASLVGLAGSVVSGMSYILFDGRATFDQSGKLSASDPPPPLLTVSVTAMDSDASEAGDPGTFTISRSGNGSLAPLTVYYTVSGTAQNGTDYQTLSGSVTIPDSATSATVSVIPIDDSIVEGDETIVLTISPNANYTIGSMGSATVTIADNDSAPLPTVTVAASDPNASETGPDSGAFTISRSGSTESALTVQYTLGGMAGNGTDYQTLPASVTIPAGQTSAVVTVAPIDDGDIEDQETVVLTLNSSSAYIIGSPNSATVTISDNDTSVAVEVLDAEASESGPDSGTFQLSRNITPGFGGPLTVYFTMGGDTVNGTNYQQLGPSITFPAGVDRVTLDVTPIDDTLVEGQESVVLRLNPDSNYRVGIPDRGVISIADNENTAPPVIWVDDAIPAGAWTGTGGGDSWQWVSNNPPPFTGTQAHASVQAAGLHYHYFTRATATLTINPGDNLITYIFLDPSNPPREIMLQWFDGASWGHGAYWGENLIPWGTDGTPSRRRVDSILPAIGQWVRIEVPANLVDLEGRTISGLNFLLYDGKATWDTSGKSGAAPPPPPPDTTPPTIAITTPANNATVSGSSVAISADASDNVGVEGVQFKLDGATVGAENTAAPYAINWDTTSTANGPHTLTAVARDAAGNQTTSAGITVNVSNSSGAPPIVWVEDAVPTGAWAGTFGGDQWLWVGSNPTPRSGTAAHQSALAPGIHCHWFSDATTPLQVNVGDILFTYVFLDPANPPREVMLQWYDGVSWDHAAYWGADLIAWGTDGTSSQRSMGALPAVGQWVRLEVPASSVGLESRTLSGMNFVLYDGQATWDLTGK